MLECLDLLVNQDQACFLTESPISLHLIQEKKATPVL